MQGDKLAQLRALLEHHQLDYYVVPTADSHQSEYVAACDERRPFLSGFTGSKGDVVVPRAADQKALQWADGRYWLQAEKELDPEHWTLVRDGAPKVKTMAEWLAKETSEAARVGFDPLLVSLGQLEDWVAQVKKVEEKTQTKGRVHFVPMVENLVDAIWKDRPARPLNPIVPQTLEYTGESIASKVARISKKLHDSGAEALLVQSLDAVAWLLNLRGSDIPYNPVFFGYAMVVAPKDGQAVVYWYARPEQVSEEVRQHLAQESQAGQLDEQKEQAVNSAVGEWVPSKEWDATQVHFRGYDDFVADLGKLRVVGAHGFLAGSEQQAETPCRIWVDPGVCNMAAQNAVRVADVAEEKGRPVDIVYEDSPINMMKSVKNAVEIDGMRQCHLRDGAAVCQYLYWLEKVVAPNPDKSAWNECTAADQLEVFRSKQALFRGLSFPTLSSFGANGAIIHYHPNRESCAPVNDQEMYLVDSGGQYTDGTTDITRTLHLGQPTEFQRECFTRVLQGHIDLAEAVFPEGTAGPTLDVLARLPLWSAGQDYGHGTGHGVGSFLNVHEGPQSISGRPGAAFKTALRPGMTVTDEPGYYEPGQFGIRIESVLVVKPVETPMRFLDKQFLGFENLTWAPLDRKLIKGELLTAKQKIWVDQYHTDCLAKIGPLLKEQGDGETYAWLVENTKPMFAQLE